MVALPGGATACNVMGPFVGMVELLAIIQHIVPVAYPLTTKRLQNETGISMQGRMDGYPTTDATNINATTECQDTARFRGRIVVTID
jgi:hypothetical protein